MTACGCTLNPCKFVFSSRSHAHIAFLILYFLSQQFLANCNQTSCLVWRILLFAVFCEIWIFVWRERFMAISFRQVDKWQHYWRHSRWITEASSCADSKHSALCACLKLNRLWSSISAEKVSGIKLKSCSSTDCVKILKIYLKTVLLFILNTSTSTFLFFLIFPFFFFALHFWHLHHTQSLSLIL